MGIFDIFKKKKDLVDDIFGRLRYTSFRDNSKNFHEGTVIFDQKEFYNKLRYNYSEMKVELIIPHLKNELKDQGLENEIIDFDEEFIIDGISLSRITNKPPQWSLKLYSTKISHYVTIEFINQNPQKGVIVDG